MSSSHPGTVATRAPWTKFLNPLRLRSYDDRKRHRQHVPAIRRGKPTLFHVVFALKRDLPVGVVAVERPNQVVAKLCVVGNVAVRQPVPHFAPHLGALVEVFFRVSRSCPAMELKEPITE